MKRLKLLAQLSIPTCPPSVNHYTKRTRSGGITLTDEAKEFKRDVYQAIGSQAPHKPSEARLAGEFVIHAPNKRAYDLDNKMKLILDALEDARFFKNDNQFDELLIKRGEPVDGGRVDITLCEIEETA